MANLEEEFVVADNADAGLLPEGKYDVQCVECDLVEAKSGNGKFIACEWEIMGGQYAGMHATSRLNLYNTNPLAVTIARKELAHILTALGMPGLRNTDQLLGKKLTVKIVQKERKDTGELQNEIRGYFALNGVVPVMSIPEPPAPAKQTAAVPAAAISESDIPF